MPSHSSRSTRLSHAASQNGYHSKLPTVNSFHQSHQYSQPPSLSDHISNPPIVGPPPTVSNPEATLDDFGRVYMSVIQYFRALWPRQKKSKVDLKEKIARQESRLAARTRELELKRQQERVRCKWKKDGQAGWKVTRVILSNPSSPKPLAPIPQQPTPKPSPSIPSSRSVPPSSVGAPTTVKV